MKPEWVVGLLPDGVFLELWGFVRFAIHMDGSPVETRSTASRVIDMPDGPLLQIGGPAHWPEDYLQARTQR